MNNTDYMTDELRQEFLGHMIPFWMNMRDGANGGFYGLLDYDLELDKRSDKGCILNSRILWLFSSLYSRVECGSWGDIELSDATKSEWLDTAEHAYKYLRDAFWDKELGGVYWSVTYDGQPSDTTKHTYNQAFAIYGLSAYYYATGDKQALDMAYDIYHIIEDKCRDEGGYLEAFSRDFGPASNEKLSENGVMATRTMNTLLHIMEAYTELYRVERSSEVRDSIIETLDIFRNRMYDSDRGRLEVFFDHDYNSLIDLYSYGHDIEAAWLIDRTVDIILRDSNGNVTSDAASIDMSDITRVLTQKIYETTFNENGIPAEAENGVVLTTRIWWVQCEAIIGFMNGYQRDTSQVRYLDAVRSIWKYVTEWVVDRRPGSEWFSEVREDGRPIETKPVADEWKCPYHNGRMFIEMLERLG